MAHAKQEHLKNFDTLLSEIRSNAGLKEKSFGCFYLKSKSVLHFHIKPPRLYAHVFNGAKWIEVDLATSTSDRSQKQISKRIIEILPFEI